VIFTNMVIVNQGIYYIPTQGAAKASSIQFFSFATGKIKLVATMEKPAAGGLTVSSDGRWMLYTQVEQFGSDLMLVENFR
jgi:hypothetical protein